MGYSRFGHLASILLVCLGMACLVMPVLAQGEYSVRLAQVQTKAYPEITLYVEVNDASGNPITGLSQADFAVTEDGQPVQIVGFAGIGDERPVDVVFVFDTTRSMREEIEGVKDTCIAFAQLLENKGRDYRLGLVTFGDEIREVHGSGGNLTDNAQEFKGWIERLRARGGDDGPELALDAMLKGSQMRFRDKAQRVLILITDAPPHHRDDPTDFSNLTLDETLGMLESAHVTLFAVAPDLSELPEEDNVWRGLPGRYGLPAKNEYQRMAEGLGGDFYDIGREPNFTGIIERIGTAIANQYRITYRSPRPTYDGTRRDIRVSIGAGSGAESSGGGAYLEKHLLNIQSRPLVGALCLLPLLAMLAAPAGLRLVAARRAPPSAPPRVPYPPYPARPEMVQPSPTPPPASLACPHCGRPVRPGAKFCAACGQPVAVAPSQLPSLTCPQCGYAMRPGAKFCARCGYRPGAR